MDPSYERRLLKPHNSPVKSPYGSPKSKRDLYHDRLVPSRVNREKWSLMFSHLNDSKESTKKGESSSTSADQVPGAARVNGEPEVTSNTQGPKEGSRDTPTRDFFTYQCLITNELDVADPISDDHARPKDSGVVLQPKDLRKSNMFTYQTVPKKENHVSPFSLSPIGCKSQKMLKSPVKAERKIPKVPYKVLDAPELIDDFYLNLVDWSAQNILAVGLGSSMYLWNAFTSQVTKLCDLGADGDVATSVSWSERGNLVAVGTNKGVVQIWDVAAEKRISCLLGHEARVGTVAWNGDLLSSGARDRLILQRDARCASGISSPERRLVGHKQEVCGLRWSPDRQHLASGGNDNKLLVWNMHQEKPMQQYCEHTAAVKAIAWSPHQYGILASGGGTADRHIRFWNTLTEQPLQVVDTGSQVCNLAWSAHSDEIVSTHGYSQNQILVWRYPGMQQIAKLTGHTYRVLYLAVSPDGETIVTGAGDETLRFWHVFSKLKPARESRSVLNLYTRLR